MHAVLGKNRVRYLSVQQFPNSSLSFRCIGNLWFKDNLKYISKGLSVGMLRMCPILKIRFFITVFGKQNCWYTIHIKPGINQCMAHLLRGKALRSGGSARASGGRGQTLATKFRQSTWGGSWRMFGSNFASYILIPKSSGNSPGIKPSTHFILSLFWAAVTVTWDRVIYEHHKLFSYSFGI